MKKILSVVIILLMVSTQFAFAESKIQNVIWVEDTQFSFVGIQSENHSFVSGYDNEASSKSYLKIDYSPEANGDILIDGYLPLDFLVRDEVGFRISEVWLSIAYETDIKPSMIIQAQNLEGFDNPMPDKPPRLVAMGQKYGEIGYTWHQFESPFDLRFGQSTLYKIRILFDGSKAFSLRFDAMSLGDGSWRPAYNVKPAESIENYEEKLMAWTLPVSKVLSTTLMPRKTDMLKKISLTMQQGETKPYVLAITGGVDLGNVKLFFDGLPELLGEKIQIKSNTVSFMKKRWKIDATIQTKIDVAEYLSEGDMQPITQYRTGFFWLKFESKKDFKIGVYIGKLRVKSDNATDFWFPIEVKIVESITTNPIQTIAFNMVPHYQMGQNNKISKYDVWARYNTDFVDLVAHEVRNVAVHIPLMNRPSYLADKEAIKEIAKIANNHGIRSLIIDVNETYEKALMEIPNEYKSEFIRSVNDAMACIREFSVEPIIFLGSVNISKLKKIDDILSVYSGFSSSPRSCAVYEDPQLYDSAKTDIPIFKTADFDVLKNKSINAVPMFEPSPHWGNGHQMRIFAGLYSFRNEFKTICIGNYHLWHGNSLDDFDQKLADGNYSPGDLMMSYVNESYKLFPSIKWECFFEGIKDRQLLDHLKGRNLIDSSMKHFKADKFINSIWGEWGKTDPSFRNFVQTIDCNSLERILFKTIEYLDWYKGKKEPETIYISKKLIFTYGFKILDCNGETIEMTVEPQNIGGSTYIPAKYLAEPLNGMVAWDSKDKKVTIEALSNIINLTIDSKIAMLNDGQVELTNAPKIVSGRTMIPLRAASALLGLEVSWETTTKKAVCVYKSKELYY